MILEGYHGKKRDAVKPRLLHQIPSELWKETTLGIS
jgi:hypothetical protein